MGFSLPLAIAGVVMTLLAAPATAVAAGDNGNKTEKQVTFVGFSVDETKAAWHIQINRSNGDGTRDQYAIYRLVGVDSGTILGSYRFGTIRRLDARGKPIRIKAAKLGAANPMWTQAARERDWKALDKQYKFDAARLTASTTVSIRPDPDTELSFGVGEEGIMNVTAAGNILGYVLTLISGKGVILGRYRHVARVGQRVSSKIEVLSSVKTNFVAVVNRFEIAGTDPSEPSTLTYGKIVPATELGHTPKENHVYVRTMWGWAKMTPQQERMWRQSHQNRVDFAQRLHSLGAGQY